MLVLFGGLEMIEFKKAEEIIEGVDLNYDLLQTFGYLVYLVNRDEVFPTEHIISLHQRYMDLYGNQKPQELTGLKSQKENSLDKKKLVKWMTELISKNPGYYCPIIDLKTNIASGVFDL